MVLTPLTLLLLFTALNCSKDKNSVKTKFLTAQKTKIEF